MDFESQSSLIVATDQLHHLAEKPMTAQNLGDLRKRVGEVAAMLDRAKPFVEAN